MRVLCLTDFPMEPPDYRWIWHHVAESEDEVDFLSAESADRSANWGKVFTRYPNYLRLGLRALRRCERHDYDLIVAWESKVGIPVALLRRALNRSQPPLVILAFSSGFVPPLFLPVIRFALGAVDHVTILTEAEAGAYQRRFGLSLARMTRSWLGAYDLLETTRRACQDQAAPATPYLHASGRTARDYATLVEAVRHLDVKLIVHGRDYNLRGLDLPPNVEAGGLVPRDLYLELVYNCLFEIIPLKAGVTHPAGASQAVLAMMMGKPVVATRTASLVEFVEDGSTGLLVSPEDPAELAAAISHLLHNPDRRREMARRARQRFKEHYNFDAFARQTHRLLHDLHARGFAPRQEVPRRS